jgi:hypothetical protein
MTALRLKETGAHLKLSRFLLCSHSLASNFASAAEMLKSLRCIDLSSVQETIRAHHGQSKIFLDTRRRDRRYHPLKDQHHLHRLEDSPLRLMVSLQPQQVQLLKHGEWDGSALCRHCPYSTLLIVAS